MTDSGQDPEPLPIALAVVTSPHGILVEHRHDGRPTWSMPGGEIQPGESANSAAVRRVLAETGLQVRPIAVVGRRVHPLTGILAVYVQCEPEDPGILTVECLDTEDLSEVAWVPVDDAISRMPDLYEPVKRLLQTQNAS